MTFEESRRRVAETLLRRIEDAVIEGDLESAKVHSEKLLDLACNLAMREAKGYREVLEVADELADVKGFPFSH